MGKFLLMGKFLHGQVLAHGSGPGPRPWALACPLARTSPFQELAQLQTLDHSNLAGVGWGGVGWGVGGFFESFAVFVGGGWGTPAPHTRTFLVGLQAQLAEIECCLGIPCSGNLLGKSW